MALNAIIWLNELLILTFDGEWCSAEWMMRVYMGHYGAGGHEINGLLCRTAMYQTESIVQETIATVTGHHRPPDCTLHDVETARNEEKRSMRYVSPRLRGIIITLQPQLFIDAFLIGLTQRCARRARKNTFSRFNRGPFISHRRLLKRNYYYKN